MNYTPRDSGRPAAPQRRAGQSRAQRARNAIVAGLLRSPLQRLVSGRLLVIIVTGRKTGAAYRIPVGYRQDDDALLVATTATWRHNLRPAAPVTVLLRGRCYRATAEVITDEQRCAELYRGILSGNPVNGKYVGIRADADGGPNLADLRQALARGFAIVKLALLAASPVTATTVPRPLWPRLVFRAAVSIETLLAFAQPVLIGGFLQGNYSWLALHQVNAVFTAVAAMLMVAAAVLYWRPGRGPAWPVFASAGIVAAIAAQIAVGFARALIVHVPLGVAIIAGSVRLLAWAWHPDRAGAGGGTADDAAIAGAGRGSSGGES